MKYNLCAIIPTHNHYKSLGKTTNSLLRKNLTVFIIDDGSGQKTQDTINKLANRHDQVITQRHSQNMGKGIALKTGLILARKNGFTHAFQIDADGQHDLSVVKDFINISSENPQALISGNPIYDHSIPLGRRIGRWLTHFWVWIETLSFRIKDSMCGFRIYPILETLKIYERYDIGLRMDFDIEIMVRLFWNKTPVIMSPVKVIYPQENHSNFDVLQDNWRITKMHTRLFFSMIFNIFSVVSNRPSYSMLTLNASKGSRHWSSLKERGTFMGLCILLKTLVILGKRVSFIVGLPVLFFYYLSGSEQRKNSAYFLARALNRRPHFQDKVRHFIEFYRMMLDKLSAWNGTLDASEIDTDGVEQFRKIMQQKTGGLLLVSHLGNIDLCRAAAERNHKNRLHILLHSKNSKKFTEIIRKLDPSSRDNVIEVTDIGADTIIFLKERIDHGEWVAIAADRIPIQQADTPSERISKALFLGKKAPFSQGPYILASLLKCPVYTVFALRKGNKQHIKIDNFSHEISLSRTNRETKLKEYTQKYASILEIHAKEHPYEWGNFFDFWQDKT